MRIKNTKEIKRAIEQAVNKGYWSGYNKEISKEVDALAKSEAERIVNLFFIPDVSFAERKACVNCRYNEAETMHDKLYCRDCKLLDRFTQA